MLSVVFVSASRKAVEMGMSMNFLHRKRNKDEVPNLLYRRALGNASGKLALKCTAVRLTKTVNIS